MAEWARLDVDFFRHPQVSALKPVEQLGYLAMILYAQEHETDGLVLDSSMRWCDVTAKQAEAMRAVGLVERTDGGWQINGFLNHQRSRSEMDAERAANRERAASARRRKQEVSRHA